MSETEFVEVVVNVKLAVPLPEGIFISGCGGRYMEGFFEFEFAARGRTEDEVRERLKAFRAAVAKAISG